MKSIRRSPPALSLLAGLAVVTLAACEEEVVTAPQADQPFALYGVLSPELDEQSIFVFPVEGTLNPRDASALDAVVTSTDLSTGERVLWLDSLVQNGRGHIEHVFWAPFRAGYDRTYRVEARRSDGNTSFADATVPPQTTLEAGEAAGSGGFVIVPVRVLGAAPHLLRIRVTYFVSYLPSAQGTSVSVAIPLVYDGKQQAIPGGWEIPVSLRQDYGEVRAAIQRRLDTGVDQTYGIRLAGINVSLIVAADDWRPPASGFDPEVLSQPGMMENVQNGFGLVTAGYRSDLTFTPSAEAVRASGFTFQPPQEAPP